jgi:hypothetical protein
MMGTERAAITAALRTRPSRQAEVGGGLTPSGL